MMADSRDEETSLRFIISFYFIVFPSQKTTGEKKVQRRLAKFSPFYLLLSMSYFLPLLPGKKLSNTTKKKLRRRDLSSRELTRNTTNMISE